MISKLGALFLPLALVALCATAALSQERGAVFDEAGALSDAEEREVQQAFDEAAGDTGQPLYAFLVPDEDVPEGEARKDLLREEADEAGVPNGAGVIVVAPEDEWALVSPEVDDAQGVFEEMVPGLRDGDYAGALVAGAGRISDESTAVPEAFAFGGGLLVVAGLVGGVLFARREARKRRELAHKRRLAEEEFASSGARMREFGEKEGLVRGYLEAQRPLLDRGTEEEVAALIEEAGGAGFGAEFNEAAGLLSSKPESALEKIREGEELLERALEKLDRAERTMDGYREAEGALDARLRQALEEIEAAEGPAREDGALVEAPDLRSEHRRLSEEAASRHGRRETFDPRELLAEVDALIGKARVHRERGRRPPNFREG